MATSRYPFGSLVTVLMLTLWAELGGAPGLTRHLQNQPLPAGRVIPGSSLTGPWSSGPQYKQDGRKAVCLGSTACGHSSSLGPLPRSSPVPCLAPHPGQPDGRGPPCLQGRKQNSGRGKTHPGRQGFPSSHVHLSPAGELLDCKRLKLAPVFAFCWRPRCIITCQHIRWAYLLY